ncbi:MAG TPA: surface-adhesin E family protein, partial [Bacteroidota bacterium]
MPRMTLIAPLLSGLLILSACAESAHQIQRNAVHLGVPPELEKQIDTSVAFADLHAAPANYVGRVVMVGGIVIGAKRTKDQTEIEVLELPTKGEGPSTKDRLRSEGRFLAVREEFLDPASVPPGTPISVIGVVRGSTARPLDESEYTYPVVEIKHLIDWNAVMSRGPADTKWVAVEKDYLSPQIQTVYIDPDTVSREGNLVTVSQLIDYKWMQGTGAVINPYAFGRLYRYQLAPHGFFSTTTRKQFDCANKHVRLLAFTEFSHHMGTGRRNNGYVDQETWLPVEPESVNHALW